MLRLIRSFIAVSAMFITLFQCQNTDVLSNTPPGRRLRIIKLIDVDTPPVESRYLKVTPIFP